MTNKVGLIGFPVTHSISPTMHNAAFRELGMDWEYDAMAIPPDILKYGLREPMQHGYIGLNVTIPHKEAVMRLVTPDPIARAVGAINTIDFRTNTGTNTDVQGFIDDLKAYHIPLKDQTVAVLGAGGAARAAVYGLAREGATVVVVNRTMQKAQVMLADLTMSAGIKGIEAVTLDDAVDMPLSLIVNCTSAGLYPNIADSPWVDGVPFPRNITVYDMIYRPMKTKFMTQAENAGGRALGGLGMLVRQGALAFKLWTGIDAPFETMYATALIELALKG
ncbi:MAG: shikimate dehydrogenase [Phototrophicales bacterium]|nr:shikimate dehydrogenase [Phototrophicales bacterium]